MNPGYAVSFVAALVWIGAAISATIQQANNIHNTGMRGVAVAALIVAVVALLLGLATSAASSHDHHQRDHQ